MIEFRNERVVSFELDYFDVYWEIAPTNEDLQEYEFYLERSEAEAGPWDQIAGPLVDRYYVRDNNVPLITTNARTLYYRVKALHVPSGTILYSRTFDREGDITLMGKEMIRLERVLFEEFVGVKCWLFPRRTFGQRCPNCYDHVLDKVIDDECKTCFGTSYSGGYHYPVSFWAQIDQPEEAEQVTIEDHRRVLYFQMRTGPTPGVKPMDLVVDHQNRRFRVIQVGGTSRLGVTVRQEVKLVNIQKGSIEDLIGLKVDNSTVSLVPDRVFSNPHTLQDSTPGTDQIFSAYGYK